eukprot:g3347.t1
MFKKRKRKGKQRKYSSSVSQTDGKEENNGGDGDGVRPRGGDAAPSAKRERKDKTNTFATTRTDSSKKSNLSSLSTVASKREVKSEVDHRSNATATDETGTATDRDATALLRRNIVLNESGEAEDATKYRGKAGYKSYIKRDLSQIAMSKAKGRQGPMRRPQFFRSTIRVDYQPDVCKDYKETGTCGFGDTCIYLHDRGDYKKGWQLEREWEIKKRRDEARRRGEVVSEDDDDDDGKYKIDSDEEELPFACLICRKEFTVEKRVIVTTCKHYFHRDCVVRRYQKGKKRCYVCKKSTGGVFNIAHDLEKRLSLKAGACPPAGPLASEDAVPV